MVSGDPAMPNCGVCPKVPVCQTGSFWPPRRPFVRLLEYSFAVPLEIVPSAPEADRRADD